MIRSRHRRIAHALPALALLGWLAVESTPPALADATRSTGYVDDALARLQRDDPQAAIIQLRNALQEDPDNLRARRILGEVYLDQGRLPDAEKELRRVYQQTPDPDIQLLLARAVLGQDRAEEVLSLLEDADGDGDAGSARDIALTRAEAFLTLDRVTDARAALAPVLAANPLNADVSIMEARISLAEGDIAGAKARVARAIEIDSTSVQAWMLDAQIKSGEGRYEQALAALDRAGDLAPGNTRLKVLRAEVLIRRAKFDDAEQIVSEVLALSPGDVAANFLLATVQSSKGDLTEADATLRKIADVTRDVDEVTLLSGVVKLGIGQHAQAETLLAKYVASVPDNLPVRRLLAGLQLQQDSPRAAADTLEPVATPQSTDAISLQLMSSAQIRMGDIEGARRSLLRLAELGKAPSAQQAVTLLSVLDGSDGKIPSDRVRLEMARVLDLIRSGEGDAALAAARALAEDRPDNPVALNLYGLAQMVSGDEKTARTLFERAISLDPGYIDAHKNLDRLDIRDARFDVLERRLKRRIADDLDAEASAIQLARLLVSQSRPDDAFALLNEQAAARPDAVLLRRVLLALAVQQDRKDEAAGTIDELMALGEAGNPLAYRAAGDHLFNTEDYDAAVYAFTKLNMAKPDQPKLLIALAQSQYKAGDVEGARATLLHVRKLQPTHVVANNSLVDLDLETGQLDQALAFTDELAGVAPAQAARLRSKVLLRMNEPDQAVAVLEQALAATPSPTLSRELFRVRRALGRDDEAIEGLKSWIAINPDDVAALDALGDAHVERRELEAALPYFERAYRLTLSDPVLLNDLSWVRQALGRPGAEDLARRAYQMRPSPAIGDTLGWILVQKGETEQGLKLLREAHQGLQDNPDIRYHLAYALHNAGDAESAEKLLLELKDWPQPFMERDRALELLEALKRS